MSAQVDSQVMETASKPVPRDLGVSKSNEGFKLWICMNFVLQVIYHMNFQNLLVDEAKST